MYGACASCGDILEIAEFPYSVNCRTFKHYPMKDCKMCKANHARTVRSLQKIFPRPPEGSRCDLCNRPEKRLFLDHDHNKTGVSSFRGYLCLRCNVSACSYSIPELEQTIAYLRKFQNRTPQTPSIISENSDISSP